MTEYHIEQLNKTHDRGNFSCGIPILDEYLHHHANQYKKKGLAVTYVIIKTNEPNVLGYYSLSSYGIKLDQLPNEIMKKLPRFPVVPVTLLGRLAVSYEHQGLKIGQHLLINALEQCFDVSKKQGSIGIVVDAINAKAIRFYKKFGFIELPDNKNNLFISMKTISKLFI
ncbi:MAG: GNAT family N-acetyltransferase [Legionella sp.]|nr:GNAT family N-acetyltransferase [Legionella sp.]